LTVETKRNGERQVKEVQIRSDKCIEFVVRRKKKSAFARIKPSHAAGFSSSFLQANFKPFISPTLFHKKHPERSQISTTPSYLVSVLIYFFSDFQKHHQKKLKITKAQYLRKHPHKKQKKIPTKPKPFGRHVLRRPPSTRLSTQPSLSHELALTRVRFYLCRRSLFARRFFSI